ncbi:MAG: hypothetical protein ACTSQI_07655 [Candidatus Helarchaeota archaeon]
MAQTFFEFLASLPLDQIFFFTCWVLVLVFPFVIVALWVKKRVKVGKIDTYQFSVYYFILLIFLYWGLIYLWGDENTNRFFVQTLGAWVGVIVFCVIFNRVSEPVRKTWVLELEIETFNVNIKSCHTYTDNRGRTCIIIYDEEGEEPLSEFFKRLFGKRVYLDKTEASFQFTESHVNEALICTSASWQICIELPDGRLIDYEEYEPYMDQLTKMFGKLKKRSVFRVIPVPTLKYNQMTFLMHFRNYMAINKDLAKMFHENMKLRKNIWIVARALVKEFAVMLQQALMGNTTIEDVLNEMEEDWKDEESETPQEEHPQSPVRISTSEDGEPQIEIMGKPADSYEGKYL